MVKRRNKWTLLSISLLSAVLFGLGICTEVKAISTTIQLSPTGYTKTSKGGKVFDGNGTGFTLDNNRHYRFSNSNSYTFLTFNGVEFPEYTDMYADRYYIFKIGFQIYNDGSPIIWNFENNNDLEIIAINEIGQEKFMSSDGFCTEWTPSSNGRYTCSQSANPLQIDNRTTSYFEILVKPRQDMKVVKPRIYNPDGFFKVWYGSGFGDLLIYVSDFQEFRVGDKTSQILEDDKTENQQQGQNSQDNSNQTTQEVEGATQNLLSAITGFFGAFTSATATTCQTDWGIEGFRNFDFCATQIPTELRIVFTIVASIIFIPMIWFLITSILSAFKEFQE